MKKRILALILVFVMVIPIAACGNNNEENGESGEVSIDTSDGYDYGELDCQGADFTFLNVDKDRWSMMTVLAPEEMVGEDVPDAVFKRNVKIKDLYNVNIKEINWDIYETGDYIVRQCASGDQTVDAAFVHGIATPNLINGGYLKDLSAIEELDIYEPWWNQTIREASQFGGSAKLYYLLSDISLTSFDLTWNIAVNLDMIETLKMDSPYELVKSGKWTMEKMFEMSKNASRKDANGEFSPTESSTSIYGFVTYWRYAAAGINGAGCFLTGKDAVGNPEFTGTGEKFVDVVDSWASFFTTPGAALEGQFTELTYDAIFQKERALFVGFNMPGLRGLRSVEFEYGVLPAPKYNEEQEQYYSNVNDITPVMIVPMTNGNDEKTGIILDTMAYLSYKEVLPVYYDNNLKYKAIRDVDSLAMLDIIRDTRCFEVGMLYGWITDFYNDIGGVFSGIYNGRNASSVIAKHKSSVNQNIKNYINA